MVLAKESPPDVQRRRTGVHDKPPPYENGCENGCESEVAVVQRLTGWDTRGLVKQYVSGWSLSPMSLFEEARVPLFLVLLSTLAYYKSLDGPVPLHDSRKIPCYDFGCPQRFQDLLPALITTLLTSTISTYLAWYKCAKSDKGPVFWLQPLPLAAWWLVTHVDQGADLHRHGSYNSLLSGVVLVPLVVITGITLLARYWGLGRYLRMFWIGFGVFSVIFIVARLNQGAGAWGTALHGASIDLVNKSEAPFCALPAPGYAFLDVTDGWLNKWTGSQTCGRESLLRSAASNHVPAWADDDKTLMRVTCPTAESLKGLRVQAVTRTEDFLWEDKVVDVDYQMEVLRKQVEEGFPELKRRAVEPSERPNEVLLDYSDSQSEGFVVWCGGYYDYADSHMLVRTVRKEDRISQIRDALGPENAGVTNKYNVLILYIDSVSRQHFVRKFKQTQAWLEGAYPPSRTIQFFRYMGRDKTTAKNVRAMFTNALTKKAADRTDTVTTWEHFHRNGYVTMLHDNSCQDFSAKYHGRTSVLDHQVVAPFCSPEYFKIGLHHGLWTGPFSMRRRCLGGKHVHQQGMDFIESFWSAYPMDVPRMAQGMFTEAHEPTGEVVGYMDSDMKAMLSRMDLSNTVLMIMADHGLHMGFHKSLGSHMSILENKLPVMSMFLPRGFGDDHPNLLKNAKLNEQRLTGHVDLYLTLQHLAIGLDREAPTTPTQVDADAGLIRPYSKVESSKVEEEVKALAREKFEMTPEGRPIHGRSLFTPVPTGRTCKEVYIPKEFCWCTPAVRQAVDS